MKKASHLKVVHKNPFACSYKLFSKLKSLLLPSEEKSTGTKDLIDNIEDEAQVTRGKRITAHNLFAIRPEDAIKEDGFFVR